jgi:hypothetical protein
VWNGDFVSRYITAGGDDSQFQDPDGEGYVFNTYANTDKSNLNGLKDCDANFKNCTPNGWRNSANSAWEATTSPDFSSNANVTFYNRTGHIILVQRHAKCSSSEGYLDYSAGKNDFAMMLVLEGNSIACNDNQ